MRQEIVYNGQNIFSGQAIPFVGRGTEFVQAGERWCVKDVWSLNGKITGCSFLDLISRKNALLGSFSKMIGEMEIGTGISLSPVFIDSIEFQDSDYIGFLPYSILISNYPSGQSEFHGIIEPSDEISYDEIDNFILGMTRRISAKGVPISGDEESAIENALLFVSGRSKTPVIKPFIISTTGTNLEYYLESSEESIDRITNTFSLTQTFKSDLLSPSGQIINRYTIEEANKISEITVITVDGQIDAGKYSINGITGARNLYKKFKQSMASVFLLGENIVEDLNINRLKYGFSFYSGLNSGAFPEILDDFSITISETQSSSLFSASIDGNIVANYGCLEDRFSKVSGLYNTVTGGNWHFDIIKQLYGEFYKTEAGSRQNIPQYISLNSRPLSENKTIDVMGNSISYSASFDDRFIPDSLQECSSFDCSISKTFASPRRELKENYLGGYYICQDLGFNGRESVAVNVSRTAIDTGKYVNMVDYSKAVCNSFINNDADRKYTEPISYSFSEQGRSESASLIVNYNTEEVVEI